MKRLTTIKLIGSGLLASALVAGVMQPAYAADQGELDHASSVIDQLAPGLLDETSVDTDVAVSEAEGADGITIDTGSNVNLGPEAAESSPLSFSVNYATAEVTNSDGVREFQTTSDDATAYVQPLTSGVRVLTEIGSARAPDSYSYTFDVPKGTVLSDAQDGYYLESGDDLLGKIALPWAVDANGAQLHTTYSWNDGVLTQNVDLSSPAVAYPVLADPAWSYVYSYQVTKTAAANKKLLKSCFNCYFPVKGAPKAFPKPGQLLPLKIGPANAECKFKSEFNAKNYFGYQFDATKNHVDKAGSNIIFEFRTVGGKKKLVVSAYIVNDAWWLKNAAYKKGALDNWDRFASNLNKA